MQSLINDFPLWLFFGGFFGLWSLGVYHINRKEFNTITKAIAIISVATFFLGCLGLIGYLFPV